MNWPKACALVLLSVLAFALLSFGPALFGSNFRTVVASRVYRSAQLSPDELARRIERHGLRTIVNLRGGKEHEGWYREEAEVAERLGVVLHDIDIVPERLPPRPAVVDLIEALAELPEPLLIHCAAGADRTGFASVVARMELAGDGFAEARDQLSLEYGHLPFGPGSEIARVFDLYESYLGQSEAPDRFATFDHWVREVYVPYVYSARLESEPLPEEASAGARLDLKLRITNTSPGPWRLSSDAERGIKLGVRLRRSGDAWLDYDRHGLRDGSVAPGETVDLAVAVYAPKDAGTYDMKLDLVDEHVTWFEAQGSTPLRWTLVVTESETESGL